MPDTDSMQQDDADVPQPEDPFDVSFVLPVLLQKQRLMEAAALLEASAETETLLLCRIKQLAVEKVISQVYPDAQWPGEVPLMMCLVSRAYARAGLEEQARWHVQAAALSLKSIGLEAAVNALGRNLRQVVPTEKANAFISSTKDDAESSASNTGRTLSAAAVAEGESSMGTARDSWRQQDNRASLSNDLLLMEFYFSLAEACFVSRGYTQAIGAFFKAIKHADRAISSLRESMGAAGQELKGDADKSALVSESTSSPRLLGLTALAVQSVPQSGLSKGAPLPSSAAPADDDQFTSGQHGSDTDVQLNDQNQEVRIAACKLELRRAELLMGVVEASLRVKEVEAIRQSEEAVEIFSRICGGPDDLRTLQARFLAAKMMHHVGQAPDAYRHLKEIIRSCACTESDVPGGMASWSAFSSPRQLAPEEESPRVHDPPLSPCTPGDERIKTEEATEKAGPAQPAFDDRTTVSARLQRRVELLMNCSLTIVELVGSLPKESQLEAVDFCGSVFGALARQSVGNLQERQRKRLLVLKLQENRRKAKHKQLVSSKKTAEKAGAAKAEAVDGGREEEEESGLVDRMEEWGGEERRRAAATSGEGFTGALLTLGRKLLGLMRSRNMRQQESEVMSLLLQFTELKFGEESGMPESLPS
ncbi:hypothetical protein CSUI_004195 [Cystoisospora suis]|uniref:Uncharacterized protein n=1 Tax=Cystoisospora suis TaxID=483139 RepID=A0A2C6KZM9_9APIC|nr:hypothetical protein CSUI_004195 [Cystoisospora suis]